MKDLMNECLQTDAYKRPTFKSIQATILKNMQEKYKVILVEINKTSQTKLIPMYVGSTVSPLYQNVT